MKKLLVLVLSLAMLISLAACDTGRISSTLDIKSSVGAGTKTIVVDILNDSTKIPDGPYANSDVGNNSKFLLKTGNELVSFLKSNCKLSDATIKSEKLADRERITLKYSFSSIDEYNSKTKKLADGKAIEAATLKVDGDKVTLTENPANTKNSIDSILKAVYNDPAVFDKTGKGDMGKDVAKFEQMAEMRTVTYKVGSEVKEINVKDKVDFGEELTPVSITGVIKAASVSTNADDAVSPKTGDNGIVFAFLLLLASLMGFAYLKLKPSKSN